MKTKKKDKKKDKEKKGKRPKLAANDEKRARLILEVKN